jgi:hypothetical protein
MAEHYLATSTYVYRTTYHQDGANYIIDAVHVSGTGTLPDGQSLAMIDQPTTAANIVVDNVLARTSASTVAAYRTAVKAQADASWT